MQISLKPTGLIFIITPLPTKQQEQNIYEKWLVKIKTKFKFTYIKHRLQDDLYNIISSYRCTGWQDSSKTNLEYNKNFQNLWCISLV